MTGEIPGQVLHPWANLPEWAIEQRRRLVEAETGESLPPTSELFADVKLYSLTTDPGEDSKLAASFEGGPRGLPVEVRSENLSDDQMTP